MAPPSPLLIHQAGRALHSHMRILQRKGKRIAIKLEDVFWSQLTDFAAEDKTTVSQLVFAIVDQLTADSNMTAGLRCYCMERSRKLASIQRISSVGFDMMAMIAACPSPVVVLTPARKVTAINPAFSTMMQEQRGEQQKGEALHITFADPIRAIQQRLINDPLNISVIQVGFITGTVARYYNARFALADRSKGFESLVILFVQTGK